MKNLILSFIAVLSLQAQTPPRLVETMEVTVVNVDVVVTDKSGKRITGLTQDDFEIFDRRKKQVITNFSEIGRAPTGAAARDAASAAEDGGAPMRRRNTVIFFIDSTSLDPRRRTKVFEELRRFAGTALLPGDRAMVAVWNKRLRVTQPFTASGEDVQRALYAAAEDSGGMILVNNRRMLQRQIEEELQTSLESPRAYPIGLAYETARSHASAYSEEMFAHARSLTSAVSTVLTTFTAPEDKKVLVYVGDYLPQKAGVEMWQYVEDMYRPHIDIQGLLRQESISISEWIRSMVRSANATGVTAYMISGGALQQLSSDAADNPMGLGATANATAILDAETRSSFAMTAEATGGAAFTGGDARALLQQIADDFRIYYSIGFRPTGSADGKERRIEVRTKNRAYVVRYRESYVLRTRDDEMADRVAANVYESEGRGELQVRTRADAPMSEGRNRQRVPVKVFVEGRNVTLIPQGESLAGDLLVFVCAGSPDAGASKVLRHAQRLTIPAADEARFRAGHLTFTFDVILERKGENTISAGVLDTVSGSWGLARTPVNGQEAVTESKP